MRHPNILYIWLQSVNRNGITVQMGLLHRSVFTLKSIVEHMIYCKKVKCQKHNLKPVNNILYCVQVYSSQYANKQLPRIIQACKLCIMLTDSTTHAAVEQGKLFLHHKICRLLMFQNQAAHRLCNFISLDHGGKDRKQLDSPINCLFFFIRTQSMLMEGSLRKTLLCSANGGAFPARQNTIVIAGRYSRQQ